MVVWAQSTNSLTNCIEQNSYLVDSGCALEEEALQASTQSDLFDQCLAMRRAVSTDNAATHPPTPLYTVDYVRTE